MGLHEKNWQDMDETEKRRAYDFATTTGQVVDTFEGFSKLVCNSVFDVVTGAPIEIW